MEAPLGSSPAKNRRPTVEDPLLGSTARRTTLSEATTVQRLERRVASAAMMSLSSGMKDVFSRRSGLEDAPISLKRMLWSTKSKMQASTVAVVSSDSADCAREKLVLSKVVRSL